MQWLYSAARLPGRTVDLGMEIWHRAFLTRSAVVALSVSKTAKEMGFDRATGLRALKQLHEAGLVTRLETGPGRNVRVRLEWPARKDV